MELKKTSLTRPSEAKTCVAIILAYCDYQQQTRAEESMHKVEHKTMRSFVENRLKGYDPNVLAAQMFLANPSHTIKAAVKALQKEYLDCPEVSTEVKEIMKHINL